MNTAAQDGRVGRGFLGTTCMLAWPPSRRVVLGAGEDPRTPPRLTLHHLCSGMLASREHDNVGMWRYPPAVSSSRRRGPKNTVAARPARPVFLDARPREHDRDGGVTSVQCHPRAGEDL